MPAQVHEVQGHSGPVPRGCDLQAVGSVAEEAVQLEADHGPDLAALHEVQQVRSAVARREGLACAHSGVHDDLRQLQPTEGAVCSERRLLRVQGHSLCGLLFGGDSHVGYGLHCASPLACCMRIVIRFAYAVKGFCQGGFPR
ncbi:MAG: hypothetical protein BWY79_01804 [Actinobacteria bacterium ADurb.Bin444]|nr:MAG: hypothetical protein BWY79_01804 [Actinobacteria bacterium ADurb.Bin444]